MNKVNGAGAKAVVIKAACLQMNSSTSVDENINFIEESLRSAPKLDVLALPENFAQMPATRREQYIEVGESGRVQNVLQDLAARYNTHIIAGSLPIKTDADQQKPYARCLMVSPKGEVSHYDKLHLFDVDVNTTANQAGKQRYRESDTYQRGQLGAAQLSSRVLQIGSNSVRLGASICYDLRFPELYRSFASEGVDIITVPSAFTYDTGKVHWECLLRARAIENQAFVLAPAQVGVHASGRRTWGHSMIIDPWGQLLNVQETDTGLVYADLDLGLIRQLEQTFPVIQHKRLRP